jgi:hypothetical protein
MCLFYDVLGISDDTAPNIRMTDELDELWKEYIVV